MSVALNPNAPPTPNLPRSGAADDATDQASSNNAFAQLLSTASNVQPKAVLPASAERTDRADAANAVDVDVDAEANVDDELPTGVAALAELALPWAPLGIPLPAGADAAGTRDLPDTARRDVGSRPSALAAIPDDAAAPGSSDVAAAPGDAAASADGRLASPLAPRRSAASTGDPVRPGADRLSAAIADRVRTDAYAAADALPPREPTGGKSTVPPSGGFDAYAQTSPLAATLAAWQRPDDGARVAAEGVRQAQADAAASPLPPTMAVTSAGAAAPPAVVAIETPVNAAGWNAEVAQKVAQVIVLRNDTAEIRLNPPQLGPVDVRISFATDQPTLLITAPDPATRGALEQALPLLRDLLADQGITLGQASVEGERQPPQPFASPQRDTAGIAAASSRAAEEAVSRAARPHSLVDLYA